MGLSPRGSVPLRPGDLLQFKQDGRPIAMLTAWDALSAALVEAAGLSDPAPFFQALDFQGFLLQRRA
jgi:hypothetical protein